MGLLALSNLHTEKPGSEKVRLTMASKKVTKQWAEKFYEMMVRAVQKEDQILRGTGRGKLVQRLKKWRDSQVQA